MDLTKLDIGLNYRSRTFSKEVFQKVKPVSNETFAYMSYIYTNNIQYELYCEQNVQPVNNEQFRLQDPR